MSPLFDFAGPAGLIWSPGVAAIMLLLFLCAVLALTVYRAWQRLAGSSSLRRWLIASLNLVAFTAVAVLMIPPDRPAPQREEALLLTEGSTLVSLPDHRRVYALLGAASTPGRERVQQLGLPGQLMLREPGLAALEVRGHGLNAQSWQALPAQLRVRFDPPPLNGPVDMQWPRRLVAGEPLRLAGRLALAKENRVAQLILVDPAGVTIAETSARDGQSFALQAVPKASGTMTYRLQTWRGDSLLSDNPVSTFVQENRGINLLVIQSAPSFNTRQLVNWAADRGQQVVVLTTISKDRDLVQGFNTPDQLSLTLDNDLTAWADLILLDGRRWSTMRQVQRQMILSEVVRGAGLLLMADRELAQWLELAQNEALDFSLQQAEPDRSVWPVWPGGSPASPLPLAPWRLSSRLADPNAGAALHTLTGSEEGLVLDAWQSVGEGRAAISLLRNQNSWFTEGQRGNASRYWSYLMRNLARPVSGPQWLPPSSRAIVKTGMLFEFCSTGADPGTYKLTTPDSDEVFEGTLVSHADGFPVSCGRARAGQPGWYTLELAGRDVAESAAGGEVMSVRVFEPQDWIENDRAQRQAATLARAEAVPPTQTEASRVARTRAFGPWWPFLTLLVCASLLWLERRLFDFR